MATEPQINRLRADIDANEASLPNPEANDIFAEAGESYTNQKCIDAYARVISIRRIMASAAKLTAYRQNNTQESLDQVFDHLNRLLTIWQTALDDAIKSTSTSGAARFGGLRRAPKPIREYPDS
jgi:hypothetical protein